MRAKIGRNQILLIAVSAMIALLSSCVKNSFDPEKTKAVYQNKFPIQDIDPLMTWKMTTPVSVNIAVYEDAGVDYTIRIYDADPFNSSNARLLAEGIANRGRAFTTVVDLPTALTAVCVCRIDPAKRSVMKLVSINGGLLRTEFGELSTTRAVTRAENSSITTYTPDRTESEINSLIPIAQELKNNTVLKSGDVFKIAKETSYQGKIYTDGITSGKVATVIIDGTWDPKGNISQIETGVDIIVTANGKIILPDGDATNKSLFLVGNSRFIVFKGGSIEGNNDGEGSIYCSNASGGRFNYNAGTIKVKEIHIDGSNGRLYNCGTVEIGKLNIQNIGARFINQGRAIMEENTLNSHIENGCYLEVTQHMYGDLTMGSNCAAVIENYGSEGSNAQKKFKIEQNSVITINKEAYLNNGFSVTGPTTGYALIKIGKLQNISNFSHIGGIVYYEVNEINEVITNDVWWQSKFLIALQNTKGLISKWGESPLIVPSGECTGEGNTPSDSGSDTPTQPNTYTYVFEDNFPMVGDYDFNDVVLDVTINYDRDNEQKITATRIKTALSAIGATKTLGAGLRIVNVPQSAISVSYEGPDVARFRNTLGEIFEKEVEQGNNFLTIPLFGNGHQVFGVANGTMVNSGRTTEPIYSIEIVLTHTDKSKTEPIITKDNLDFFIAYKYQTMKKRMEVHLYEFRTYGATAAGTVQEQNLDLAANNTWAICVPNFRYPLEGINICDVENPDNCAYPKFLEWARNRSTNTDWYNFPNENKVFR